MRMRGMRRTGVAVLVLLVAMSLLAGCTGQSQSTAAGATKSTIDQVLERKELIIGTAPGYFPFEMVDKQGNIIGYDVDTAQAIADALQVKLNVKQYSFDSLIPALQKGEIDLIVAGMTITPKRALTISFADPYYLTGQVVMVSKAKNPGVRSWQDLDKPGNVIGVSLGTTGAILAKQIYKQAEVRDFENFPEASLAAAQGKIDGVIYDEPGIRVYQAQHPDAVYGIYDLISVEALGIGVRKDDFSTLQWLNSFLTSYIDGPAHKASVTKWFEDMSWMDQVEN